MEFKTTDLSDDYGDEVKVCALFFKSYGLKKRFSGKIRTLKVFEDNILVREALGDIDPESVLVVDGGGSVRCALLGDQLAALAASRRVAGVIINGAVRDVADLGAIDLGILALGSNPKKSKKEGIGQRDIPLFFGNLHWQPGQYVYADEDGVVISKVRL